MVVRVASGIESADVRMSVGARLVHALAVRTLAALDLVRLGPSCYWRSRAIKILLHTCGVPASIRFGVRATPAGPEGHCWVDAISGVEREGWDVLLDDR